MLTVLLGGARSGKTSTAVRLAGSLGGEVAVIATSPRLDDETARRIERHRDERPEHWTTIEEELDLAGAIDRAGDMTAVVDCLTLWVNNLMHHGADEATVLERSDDAIGRALARRADTIVVSNEVGLGIVPDNDLGRSYRDVLGRVNQQWVAAADRGLFMVAGRALHLDEVTL